MSNCTAHHALLGLRELPGGVGAAGVAWRSSVGRPCTRLLRPGPPPADDPPPLKHSRMRQETPAEVSVRTSF